MRKRLLRAIATVTALTGGMVVAAAAPALAADEFRYYDTIFGEDQAHYKITFYGSPYAQVRKHLVIADKKADGKGPFIRVWPSSSTDPCYYIDYPDRSGEDDVAAHYDIYYPVRMIAYVLDTRHGAWGGQYNLNSQSTITASLNC
ncbi:hypothetical protein [Actinoplanes sp. URMC 104]|uniref:hypothetical protein n=1 Tax=Actinoplanes sp. URMC 104 TaxID=3423409 RepID=UPI003F1E03A7